MKIRMLRGTDRICGKVFDVSDEFGLALVESRFAEEVKEPEYKPYTKINPDWWHRELKSKHRPQTAKIVGFDDANAFPFIQLQDFKYDYSEWLTLDKVFEHWYWQDGSPFGEEQGDG